ncbi:MAG: hypothetical protein H5U13_04035 [Parvibaculum sp.]|nr:hypothetical protein [Parvibaculum sp.]
MSDRADHVLLPVGRIEIVDGTEIAESLDAGLEMRMEVPALPQAIGEADAARPVRTDLTLENEVCGRGRIADLLGDERAELQLIRIDPAMIGKLVLDEKPERGEMFALLRKLETAFELGRLEVRRAARIALPCTIDLDGPPVGDAVAKANLVDLLIVLRAVAVEGAVAPDTRSRSRPARPRASRP